MRLGSGVSTAADVGRQGGGEGQGWAWGSSCPGSWKTPGRSVLGRLKREREEKGKERMKERGIERENEGNKEL